MRDMKIGGHAVVLGASVAGLLAARALRERFQTAVDPDPLPEAAPDEAARRDLSHPQQSISPTDAADSAILSW